MARDPKNVHQSVMPREVLDFLRVRAGGRYVDGTLGAAGHARSVLAVHPTVELLGIDRDAEVIELARERLAPFGGRVAVRQGSFGDIDAWAAELGWNEVDGVLLDLGMSSLQIDEASRGFSYRQDGPLDMRMDRRSPLTASVLLNTASEQELARIFYEYGEESRSRHLARAIVARREEQPWERTGELTELIQRVLGKSRRHVPPEARCFQAIRIAVNDELGQLESCLDKAHDLLSPGGRLVVIAFHSLEDRAVKQRFRFWASSCVCPPGMPICTCGKQATVRILTRRPVTPSETETAANRRAASARLRCCEKLSLEAA